MELPFSVLVLALHFQVKQVSKLRLTYDFVASLAQIVAPGGHSSETQMIPVTSSFTQHRR